MQEKYLVIIAILLFTLALSSKVRQQSPSNIERVQTYWKWCQCGFGLENVTIWSSKSSKDNYTISISTVKWIQFSSSIRKISWYCSHSKKEKSLQVNLSNNQWLSILLYRDILQGRNKNCHIQTGRISFNIWNETSYISSVPFTTHTEGYACFKVPTLLKTEKGTLIAFSEARSPGCDDFDRTDLVYKRSFDHGKTWSSLKKLVENTYEAKGLCGHELVIGNISPVQLKNASKYPGRILAPYTRNNFRIWITYSDDDGLTWKQSKQITNVTNTAQAPYCNRNMSYFGFNVDELKLKNTPAFVKFFRLLCTLKNPFHDFNWTSKLKAPWQFIAIGPSQSLQLKNGRIIVPGYRSPIRGLSQVPGALPISQLYSGFAVGFVLISDDYGDTWILGKDWPVGEGAVEHQIIQLQDGTLLSNSRSLSVGSPQFRLQARSFTQGQTFTATEYINIPQPIGGCQGSIVYGTDGNVFLTAPNPTKKGKSIAQYLTDSLGCKVDLNGREKLSLWISHDNGKSYKLIKIIDSGLSAQTSLIFDKKKLYLLYQQADPLPKSIQGKFQSDLLDNLRVLLQSRHVFREIIYEQTTLNDY